ncbi:hypothetical protein MUN81_07040 [Hymenobacter sp. 5317J-9]|uniref:hypothetical protein n=1 Tax=Hymenobacter sp. 5317J-9 TaxID=2932250 RepID=UPI001FD6B554|nr:hypothetical protein [Hymenobacter sp. 5317J-9]UOQ99245.1 hypothetical protein MUN81_07040 [Hymenobacter sp. 5317J-9]
MKNLFLSFSKMAAVACCALTLGSCSRAEYAMLPKGASYHGVTRVTTPVPAKPEAEATPAAEVAAAPQEPVTVAAAAVAPAAPQAAKAAPAPAAKPVAAAEPAVSPAQAGAATTALADAAPARKLSGIQRLALNKVTKKVDKLMQKATARQQANTASVAKGGVSGNLRLGIILMVIGALIALLPGLFRVLGLIVFIVGVLFLLLWVLDQA